MTNFSAIVNSDCSLRITPQRLLLCTWLFPLLVTFSVSADGGELENKLAEICEKQKVPGMIAASISPDGIIESAAAGVRKRGTKLAISPDNQFALGSNSKSFTATLAAVLVEKKKIAWTTTIAEVWPDQPIHKDFQKVTLEQLLAHTGGLSANLSNNTQWATFFAERFSPQKERARMCGLVLTKAPEGTVGKHEYSNLGYVVASAMIEQRGGKPFEQLMQQHVFDPLKMTKTEFYSAKTLNKAKEPLIWGHKGNGDPIKPGTPGAENPTVYAGCGTIRTTMGDWAKYVSWHMNETAAPVLEQNESLKHLHAGTTNRGQPGQKYGFGWISFSSGFGHTLQHAGNNTNQFSLVWVMPEAKRATIVITNTGENQAFTACDVATLLLMTNPTFR